MSNLEKINILTKEKLDSLDLTQYKNQLFGTTDDPEDKAIAFAEAERQKSKNLFNDTFELGFYDISNGQPTASESYKRTANKMPIKPNTQYIFSTTNKTDAQVILFYDKNLNFISYDGMSGYTTYPFTTPTNAYYFTYYTSERVEADIQIEEGAVATDYQPYNGPITHSGDGVVVFAESERQKSKNLFDINAPKTVEGYHSFVNGNTITVEGGGSTETESVFGLIPVKENTTYYIGANVSNKRLLFRIYDENKNVITSAIPNWVYNQYWKASYADFSSPEIRTQLTIPQGAKYLALQTSWQGSQYTISNVIISEYPDIDNYQPYNGAIVHEKGIERVELIYDKDTKYVINNDAYRSGLGNNTEITGLDLSKYKTLRAYFTFYGADSAILEIDLSHYLNIICRNTYNLLEVGGNLHAYVCNVSVETDGKIKIIFQTTHTSDYLTSDWRVYRFEGVY